MHDHPPTITEDVHQSPLELRAIINGKTEMFSTVEEKFGALAEAWHEAQIGSARIDFQHAAYHQVIGMGWEAVPLLLERIRQREVGWIYAMKCITGDQVGTPELRGQQVLDAWLEWGKSRGYLSGI
jgi:hypothetical protein